MLAVAVLAAGKGTRMKSALPKVLQPLAGATLVERVLAATAGLAPDRTLLIVGHQAERVQQTLGDHPSAPQFVLQQPQNGTGHAVQQLLDPLGSFEGDLLVLNGDVPLLRESTLASLLEQHRTSGRAVTLLTAHLDDPSGYGRVFCDGDGRVQQIVEHRDCTPEQRQNTLINAGIYCFHWPRLRQVLPLLRSDNDQGELYLTDTVELLADAGHRVVDDLAEIMGINDRQQLAACEGLLQERLRRHWMAQGVTFVDPASCTLSEDTSFGRDVVVEPQTHFRGACSIGDDCRLGPGSVISDSQLGNDVQVVLSLLNGARLAAGCRVGPYAHLRPEAELGEAVRIGNFVEVKKSRIGADTKINHLSYVGDADFGRNVNVGAGTVTANYDGVNKHRTVIGDDSKTGANSVLVAPITLGRGVTVGAGSALTKNVPDGALALGRARQTVIENWAGPRPQG
jgi:bifunctional UDP-N-acetylglucosamine pyrophosphorylase/glucosamine-1-phosphate N-acetyltransferase